MYKTTIVRLDYVPRGDVTNQTWTVPPPRKRYKYRYSRYVVTYRCETCGLRLSKAPHDFPPPKGNTTVAHCPHCRSDMSVYQTVYQAMLFDDPDVAASAEVEEIAQQMNTVWHPDVLPRIELTYTPPPLKPAPKPLPVHLLQQIRGNKLDKRWGNSFRMGNLYRKEVTAAGKPLKRKQRRPVTIRRRYPRLVELWRCPTCAYKAKYNGEHSGVNTYIPYCTHDSFIRLATRDGEGAGEPLPSRAQMMYMTGLSYQPALFYPEPKQGLVVESQMLGLKNVMRQPPATLSDEERDLDAWVANNWDRWQVYVADETRELKQQHLA